MDIEIMLMNQMATGTHHANFNFFHNILSDHRALKDKHRNLSILMTTDRKSIL